MTKIQTYLERCVGERVFPGASWAVGTAAGILEKGSAGLLGTGLGPVGEDSLYDIASLTKLFVTIALMKQFEEGLIRLEDEVGYFLPFFKNYPLGGAHISALMTHTAPIAGPTHLYTHAKTREDLLEAIRSGAIRPDSPDKVLYTCEAYIILGEIVSKIDSLSLDEVIRRRVLDRLGMRDTCYRPPESFMDRIAPTEDDPWRGRMIRGEVHDENAVVMGGVSGNAGLFSSAIDMALFAMSILSSLEDRGILRKATAKLMIRNHTPGKGDNRGLGWQISTPGNSAGDLLSPRSFGHTGFTGTSVWIDPDRKLYALLLSNRVHPKRDNLAILRTRNIFHNLAVLEYGDAQGDRTRDYGHA